MHLIGRHYIFNRETLEELQIIVNNTAVAAELIRENRYPIELGLKITVDEEKVGSVMIKEAQDVLKAIPQKTWLLYDLVNRGAGTSYRQILFNPNFSAHGDSIVVSADFDQFIINTEEGLESLLGLVEDVKRKDALYGIGSRNVPVKLAKHERNSRLRIIHELFHSLTIGDDLVVPEQVKGVTLAYAGFGESSSGLYVMNQRHAAYPELLKRIDIATKTADLQGFAADYYVAIVAPQLAPLATGYVKARENKFYQDKSEEEEHQDVLGLISSQTAELLKTDIKGKLYSALVDSRTGEKIARFYNKGEVAEVKKIMMESFTY